MNERGAAGEERRGRREAEERGEREERGSGVISWAEDKKMGVLRRGREGLEREGKGRGEEGVELREATNRKIGQGMLTSEGEDDERRSAEGSGRVRKISTDTERFGN
jgi:hypothetical protein